MSTSSAYDSVKIRLFVANITLSYKMQRMSPLLVCKTTHKQKKNGKVPTLGSIVHIITMKTG